MLRLLCIAVVITSAAACTGAEVQFAELRSAPARFAGKKVTVRGLVEVAGDDILLWPDVATCKRQAYKETIYVVQDLRKPPYPGTNLSLYSPANLHWAKVSGTVDISYHGRWGDEPFGLILGNIEVLPGPRLKHLLPILAYLNNETGMDVQVRLQAGGLSESSTISRGEVYEVALPRQGWHVFISYAGRPFVSSFIGRRVGAYYDGERRAYYYRITRQSVVPVLPPDARHWRFAPSPERD